MRSPSEGLFFGIEMWQRVSPVFSILFVLFIGVQFIIEPLVAHQNTITEVIDLVPKFDSKILINLF